MSSSNLKNNNNNNNKQSILVIGAAGRIGVEVIHTLAQHTSKPDIHAFCIDSTSLHDSAWILCTSVIEGSGRHAIDIEEALYSCKANCIILCIGTGDDTSPSNVRTLAGTNVSRLLQKPDFQHIHVVCVSIAPVPNVYTKYRLRHVIADHRGQEMALAPLGRRVLIVRSTQFVATTVCNKQVEVDVEMKNNARTSRRYHRRISSSATTATTESSTSSTSTSSTTTYSSKNTPIMESDTTSISSSDEAQSNPIIRIKDNSTVTTIGDCTVAPSSTRIVQYGQQVKSPSKSTNRTDLACWITEVICDKNCLHNGFLIDTRTGIRQALKRHSAALTVHVTSI